MAGEPRSSGPENRRVPHGTKLTRGNAVARTTSSTVAFPASTSVNPGLRATARTRCSAPRRMSPSMRTVRRPASASPRARLEARNDLPSLRPGLVMVQTSGPAAPCAYCTLSRMPRIASMMGSPPSWTEPLRRCFKCGTAPRIGSPITRVTSSGSRTLRSRWSSSTAAPPPAPNPPMSPSTTSTGSRLNAGRKGTAARSRMRTSGILLTSASRASS